MSRLPSRITKLIEELEAQDPDALVAVFDALGYYHYASANHQEILDYTADELLKIHLSKIVDPAYHHRAFVLRTISVFYDRPIRFSSNLITKAGHRVQVAGTLQHFRDPGDERFFITFVRAEV